MVKTIITWTVFIILLCTSVWFFLIKEHDYSISFKTDKTPGEVYQQLLYYDYDNIEKLEDQENFPFHQLSQKVFVNGEKLDLTWKFSKYDDSLSRATASVEHRENPFLARFKTLVGTQETQGILKNEVRKIQQEIKTESSFYRIKVKGKTISPATKCACIALESEVTHKARLMMKTINNLSAYIRFYQIETVAKPRVNVLKWDKNLNEIEYEFCFPISSAANPVETDKIYIKDIPAQPSLKAIFNGNYMYSHLAWVKLLDYAEMNNIEVREEPLEIFNNNPETGGDALQWEAEIYLPLKTL